LSASYAQTASYANNFTVAGTLTAQTIVVQTITSSTDYITGSTRFGSLSSNTHVFTGSVSISGSLTIVGSVSGSSFTGSLLGTATTASYYGGNVTSASYASSSTSASYASSSTSASYATTSSFATTASYVLGGSSTIAIQDEGAAQGSAGTINFTGTGVTATVAAGVATVNIPGGAGSTFPYTGSAIISGSLTVIGFVSGSSFTGSLLGTATTASYYGGNVTSASYASSSTSASYASSSTSASYSTTSSYTLNVDGGFY